MSLSAQDALRLRATTHKTKLYLCVYRPATLWTARVATSGNRGDTAITVSDVVELKTPFRHTTVLFGSSPGARDKGEARYKGYANSVLSVGAHQYTPTVGDYITIVEEIKPTTVLPKIQANGVVLEDAELVYNDENTKYHPLVRMGPPAVAFLRNGQAKVKFYSTSIPVASGATLTTYNWQFPEGSPSFVTAPGTREAPIEVIWTRSGQFYVHLAVVDSNMKVHTGYRPVFIIDENDHTQYYDAIEITRLEGDVEQGGWECNLKILNASATETEFPDRALAVLFAEDWYGDEYISLGGEYAYRENIVFVGYVVKNTVKRDWKQGTIEFELRGIGRLLDNLTAWAANLKRSDSPSQWHELKDADVGKAIFHILTEHSTLDHICDLTINVPSYSLDTIDVTEGTLREQCTQHLLASVRSRIASNRQGMLYALPNPQLLPLAQRPTDVALNLEFDDLRDEIDLGPEMHEKVVNRIDFFGFKILSAEPWYEPITSFAPPYGCQWSTGRPERIDGVTVNSQDEADELAGLYEAWHNNEFSEVTFPLRGNYRLVDIVPHKRLIFSIQPGQNQRGIRWDNQTFWAKRVSFECKFGYLLATIVAEKESYGDKGKAGEVPVNPPAVPAPPPPWPAPYIPPPPPVSTGSVYDIGDGFSSSDLVVKAGLTSTLLYWITTRRWKISIFSISCAVDGVVFKVYAGYGNPDIVATRSGTTWTIDRYNGQTGDFISTRSLTGTTVSVTFEGSDIITVPASGLVFKTTLTAGAVGVGEFGYGLGGQTF